MTSPSVELRTLIALKERTKGLFRDADSAADRGAVLVLYDLAIAAAYVRHDRAISSRPAAESLARFEDLVILLDDDAAVEVLRAAVDHLDATA